MKKFHATLLFTVLILLAPILATPVEQYEQSSATLFPGQTVTVLGIKITWNFKENQTPELPMGTFDIVGPNKSIKDLPAKGITAYIDEVVLNIYVKEASGSRPSLFEIKAQKFLQKYNMGGRPYNIDCYVSNICPITINELNFRVSDEKNVFPNGSSYYVLEILDSKSGEKTSIPMNPGALGQAFQVNVHFASVYEETKTANLRVTAKADYSVRGKDAWVESLNAEDTNLKDFLERLGKQYGFNVKWVPYPDHPESIKKMQNYDVRFGYFWHNKTIEDTIRDLTQNMAVSLDWETSSVLAISPKNYDLYLKIAQENKEKEEKEQKVREEFKRDYALETRAYTIKTVSVQTAKSLIAPELDTYFLAMVDNDAHLEIIPGRNVNKLPIIKTDKVEESVEADEKTGMLFLTATKKTHEKFLSLMVAIDAWVKHAAPPAEAKPYKVVVTLLEGSKMTGMVMPGVPIAMDLPWIDAAKAAEQYGISKDDLKVASIDIVRPVSTGIIFLLPEKGEAGKAMVALQGGYSCYLEFLDRREPYVIVRAKLVQNQTVLSVSNTVTLSDTALYLVPGKPTLMGITNLINAQIIILKLEPAEKEQK